MTLSHSDAVNRPKHYAGDIECIDAMTQQFGPEIVKHACVVQAFEMLWRWQQKGDADENLAKAAWWLNFALGQDPRTYKSIDDATEADWNGLKHRYEVRLNTSTNESEVIDHANNSENKHQRISTRVE